MSITDELRHNIKGAEQLYGRECTRLTAIADRIDAEHERAEQDLIDANNQMEQLCECSVELPKDADNVPWSIGDRDEDGNVVIELRLTSSGWFVVTDDMGPYRPERKRHYHAPTVEDVLREFAYGLGVPVADSYVAATAAKLRLAEGEDA